MTKGGNENDGHESLLLVVVGTSDKLFFADKFEPVISQYNTGAEVKLVKDLTHMGVVVNLAVQPVIKEWLQGFNK